MANKTQRVNITSGPGWKRCTQGSRTQVNIRMPSPGERLRPSRRGSRAWQPNAAALQCPPGASGRLPCAHSGATSELKTEAKIQQLYQHGFSSNGVARAPKWGRNVQAGLMERLDRHTQKGASTATTPSPECCCPGASMQAAGTQFEELERAHLERA